MRTMSLTASLKRLAVSFFAVTAAIFLASLFAPSAFGQGRSPDKVQIIVKFAPGLSDNDRAAAIARNGGTEKARVNQLGFRIIEVPAAQADQVLAKYASDANVQRAEKSKQRQTDRAALDPLYGSQWGLPKIGWDQVFGVSTPTGSATVAVLDTGISASHPDLVGQVVAGTSILDGSNGMTDPNGHGTAVAGIIAARTENGEGLSGVGFAGVRVMPVVVLDSQGLGEDADVIAGVVWAADNGANVIVMAFSNPGFSQGLQDAIDYAWSKGVVLVASAGNDAWSTPMFPAGDRGVIGVAATDENDAPAEFSNEGPSVFLAAPGTNIQTTASSGGYQGLSGTSASAAFVAGAAALLKAFDPEVTNGIIVGRLARTADPAGTQADTGNGRLNLARALSDTATASIQPAGADPIGAGGPFVGPYVADAVTDVTITSPTTGSPIQIVSTSLPANFCVSFTYTMNGSANGSATASVRHAFGAVSTSPTLTVAPGNNVATQCWTLPSTVGNGTYSVSVTVSQPPNSSRQDTETSAVKIARNTLTNLSCNTPVAAGSPTNCTVTVADNSPGTAITPTGSFNVSASGAAVSPTLRLCALTQVSPGVAQCTGLSFTPGVTGTINVAASYPGDGNHFGSGNTASVTSTNTPPVAADQSVTTNEDTQRIITLGGSDANGNSLTFSIVTGPAHGTLSSISGTGCGFPTTPSNCTANVTYTPAANYNGPDSFTFKVNDGLADSSAAQVSITVAAVNDAPVAANDSYSANEDSPLSVAAPGVLGNDTDIDSGTLTAVLVSGPSHGTLTLNSNGSFSYVPAADYNGTDSFTYRASDGSLSSNVATVTISINALNDAPVAKNDAYSTNEDVALTIGQGAGVLKNDADVDGNPLTAILVVGPSNGTLILDANGSFTYTPATNYNGTDTFTYKANDGSLDSNVATVTITVNSVNDAPVAGNDAYVTNEDTPLSVAANGVLGNDADLDGNALTAILVSGPANGTLSLSSDGSFTYSPAPNFNGTDTFTYKANDGTADSNVATVTITVNAVADAPVATGRNVATDEDTGLVIELNGSDVDTTTLSFTIVSPPSYGGVGAVGAPTCTPAGSGTTCTAFVTYTPNPNFNGNDSFTFKVNGGGLDSTTATVFIAVKSVNDTPLAASQSVTTNEDSPKEIILTATDVEGTSLAFSVNAPSQGTLGSITALGCSPIPGGAECSAKVTYTPASNYNGPDSFTFTVSDGQATSPPATVSIDVLAINDAPEIIGKSVELDEDTALSIKLEGIDIDSAGLTFSIVSGTSNGTLGAFDPVSCAPQVGGGVICSVNVVYAPAPNFNGNDSFTFKANDGSLDSNVAEVKIKVRPVNDPPLANNGSAATDEDAPVGISLSASDIDGDSLTYIVTSGPSNGTLSGTGATRTYTPNPNFNGSDSFSFKVNDGTVDSNVATVSITVRPANDTPTADDKALTLDEDTSASVTLSGSDVETAAANLTFTIVSGPSHGTLSGTAPNLTYTPAANYNGPDSFTYTVTDRGDPDNCSSAPCAAAKSSNPATVSITVRPVNDPPAADSGGVTTPEDTPINVVIVARDIDSGSLAFTVVSGPSHGSLSPMSGTMTCTAAPNRTGTPGSNCTATLLYTPSLNYNSPDDGPEAFTFKVRDASMDSNVATVNIAVTPVNDPPANLAVTASAQSLNEGDTLTLTGSFADPDKNDAHSVTVNWGDGSAPETFALPSGASGFSVRHVYRDDNPTATPFDVNNISVTVTDREGSNASAVGTVTVHNVVPVVTLVAGPEAPIALTGNTATVTVTFTDIGTADTHTCAISWDDGTTTAGTVTETNGSGTCTGTHTFAAAGVYEPKVTIVDDDGGSSVTTSYQFIVVYNPNGGFVTGGGWINSPAGAYIASPTLTGKANFGFVSKYQKGANVPAGETEFQFKAGDLNFKSTVYEWLVISGAKAQYKGSGTINGAGSYGFLLTATDGQVSGGGGVDRFRIKIWDKATSNLVYDNAPSSSDDIDVVNPQQIGGGSITIHKN